MRMNAEQWLNRIKKYDQLIDAKIAERDRLYSLATDATAKPYDGMPHDDTGMVNRRLEDIIIKVITLAHEIDRLIDKYIDYKQYVVSMLEKLPDKEYGVLHRYYIRYMTIEQIAEDMNYSVRQILRIKKNGLQNLEDVIASHIKK